MLGKKLYRTGLLNILRLVIIMVVVFFINDFILETYTYSKFESTGHFRIIDVFKYHYKYPWEFLTFCLMILFPAFYYVLIRGTRFFERGFVFNRGLPFLNKTVMYEEVKGYKLLHPQNLVGIHTNKGEHFIIMDNNLERVIAILDQHNIQGDLARDDYVNLLANIRKFIIIVLSFTVLMFVLKKFLAG